MLSCVSVHYAVQGCSTFEYVDEILNFDCEPAVKGHKGFKAYVSGNVMSVNENSFAVACGSHVILFWC